MAAYQHICPVVDVNKIPESRTESTHAVNTPTNGARPQGPQNASFVGSLYTRACLRMSDFHLHWERLCLVKHTKCVIGCGCCCFVNRSFKGAM